MNIMPLISYISGKDIDFDLSENLMLYEAFTNADRDAMLPLASEIKRCVDDSNVYLLAQLLSELESSIHG